MLHSAICVVIALSGSFLEGRYHPTVCVALCLPTIEHFISVFVFIFAGPSQSASPKLS